MVPRARAELSEAISAWNKCIRKQFNHRTVSNHHLTSEIIIVISQKWLLLKKHSYNSSSVYEVCDSCQYQVLFCTWVWQNTVTFPKAVKMKVCTWVDALVWQSRWILIPGPICAVGRLTIWRTLLSLEPIIVAPDNPGIIRSFARSSQIIIQ